MASHFNQIEEGRAESDLWWRMAQRAHEVAAAYEQPKDTLMSLRENIVQPIVNAMHEVWLKHRYPEVNS